MKEKLFEMCPCGRHGNILLLQKQLAICSVEAGNYILDISDKTAATPETVSEIRKQLENSGLPKLEEGGIDNLEINMVKVTLSCPRNRPHPIFGLL
jgi:DNA-binding Lrp family transcriptional regulator